MTGTKKSLIASGVALLASVALLAGTTFAWFTDSVTNTGNKIQAGTLDITATVAEVDPDVTAFIIKNATTGETVNGGKPFGFGEPRDIEKVPGAIISEENWEPGQSSAKLLTVTNNGTLAAKVKLDFSVIESELAGALWYDFIRVTDGAAQGTFTKRPMSTLEEMEALEFPLESGENLRFILVYGMDEEAGNDFQDKSFAADVAILAKQTPKEEDGFGDPNYDADAAYLVPVSNGEELKEAAAEGGHIQLTEAITLDDSLTFSKDIVLHLNGQTLTVGGGGTLRAPVGTTLTVEGNGTIHGVLYAEKTGMKSGSIVVNAGENLQVVAPADKGYAVYGGMGSSIRLNGGTYTAFNKNGVGMGVIETKMYSTLEIRDAVINVKADTVIHMVGIYAGGASNRLENVTVNGRYSTAADFDYANGNTVIRGGSFVTNRKADDGFYNPTIKYQGTLDIADAIITRVGTGIQCTTLNTTEVTGLTYDNLTFISVGDVTDPEIAHK